MGKFVGQPGDNQYQREAQLGRHPISQYSQNKTAAVTTQVPVTSWLPKPDLSIEPIPADEPIVLAGFPPLPQFVDLPVVTGWSAAAAPSPQPASCRGGTRMQVNHVPPPPRQKSPNSNSRGGINDRTIGDQPDTVRLNQTQTQDLSLPDDDFSSKRPPSAPIRLIKKLSEKILQRGASDGGLINF